MSIMIELSNDIRILKTKAFTLDAMEELKRKLTFDNPEYIKSRKYGYSIPGDMKPVLTYYREDIMGYIHLPRGYLNQLITFLNWHAIQWEIEDKTHICPEIDINFTGELKEHQKKALGAILKQPFGVLDSPTSSGKTVIALAAIAERKQPTLVLVHTYELMKQWKERALQFTDLQAREVGFYGGGSHNVGSKLTIGIMGSVKGKDQLNKRFGQIIIDEVHHVPARTFAETVSMFSTKYMLGLSATPSREDGLTSVIHYYVGDLVYRIEPPELTRKGIIMRAKLNPRYTDFYCQDVEKYYNSFLRKMSRDQKRNLLVVGDIEEHVKNSNGTALVFTARKEHCSTLSKMLRGKGIDSRVLFGTDRKTDRAETKEELVNGEIKVLIATPHLLGEGFDHGGFTAVFLAAPISSRNRLKQCIGRVTRVADGKETPMVYDYIDKHPVNKAGFNFRCKVYKEMEVIQEQAANKKFDREEKIFEKGVSNSDCTHRQTGVPY